MMNRKERMKTDIIGLCVKGKITAKDALKKGLNIAIPLDMDGYVHKKHVGAS